MFIKYNKYQYKKAFQYIGKNALGFKDFKSNEYSLVEHIANMYDIG